MKCPNCQNPNITYTVKIKRTKTRDVKKGEIGKPIALLTTPFNTVPKIDVVEEMDKIERRESLEEGRGEK